MRTLCRPFQAFRWFPIHKPSSNSTVECIVATLEFFCSSVAGLNLCKYKGCVVSEDAVASGLMETIANFEVQVDMLKLCIKIEFNLSSFRSELRTRIS